MIRYQLLSEGLTYKREITFGNDEMWHNHSRMYSKPEPLSTVVAEKDKKEKEEFLADAKEKMKKAKASVRKDGKLNLNQDKKMKD